MQRTGTLFRSFLVRRTVRWRMTLLYGALFLLSGAILLVISGGVAARSTSRVVQRAAAAGGPASGQSALAQANGKIRQLQGQLAAAQHAHSASVTHQLVVGALIALAVMAAVSALLGWLMAGHALRPLRTMIATTRRISEDNLHQRLAFTGPEDELKQLADTIDDLLERLEGAFAAQRLFVANASHELRTPLATMRASLDVALAKPDPVRPRLPRWRPGWEPNWTASMTCSRDSWFWPVHSTARCPMAVRASWPIWRRHPSPRTPSLRETGA